MDENTSTVTRPVKGIDAALAIAGELADRWRLGAVERDRTRAFPHAEIAELKTSGIHALGVPEADGGSGATYGERCRVLRRIAEVDPSIGQIFLVHLYWTEVMNQAAPEQLRSELNQKIARGELWLGNAASELGTRTAVESSLTMSKDGTGWLLNGRKFYCTGSLAADLLVVTGSDPATQEHRLAFVPVDTPGVSIIDDWSGMGQRGTSSGSAEFVNARVPASRVPDPDTFMGLFESQSSMITVFAQSLLSSIHVGIAKNALHDTIEYVRSRARPWFQSDVNRASDDPYVLRHIGRMQAQLDATEALQDRAYQIMDDAGASPSDTGRGEAIVAVSKVKLMSTEVGLEICERLFQVSGASGTVAKYGLDRHWRNLRTLSLHDPVDYKAKLIGDHAVNHRYPRVSYYT
ncbi:SfnB family sulfur acquisition oxidoreductase [Planosporangium flavigriseum]|uniref:Dibenzothiophene monooxygenase n=1 Tax=Planosporangium flavigriseum TaxID=373681 RepID=A0A8J3PM70_9ACTN|nr:acyl-CoA dehydrogenase family protein [Planosporangium flavigriseum]NJC65727.1 SfnB family sulfur acquisition oxidoreductase [Planosporangium flavigriseum]GIG73578.1 SfnB family sulfur acquisition oxidoreductase [Planosporangium flavigriseum]